MKKRAPVVLYALFVPPCENENGSSCTEWFSAYSAAHAQRGRYVRKIRAGLLLPLYPGLQIEQVTLIDTTPRKLLIAALNQRGLVQARVLLKGPYEGPVGRFDKDLGES